MKHWIFLILFIPFCSSAQDSTKVKFKHWQVGYNISPDYCYRLLNGKNTPYSGGIISQRNSYEKPQFGITTGFNVCYSFKKVISIETGINYSNVGYHTKDYTDFISNDPNDPLVPSKVKYRYNFNYIDIPLQINLIAGKKNFFFISNMGIVSDFLLKYKETAYLEYADGTQTTRVYSSHPGVNFISFTLTAGAGVGIKCNERFSFRAIPTFRYQLAFNQTSGIKEHLWNVGLNLGVYLKI